MKYSVRIDFLILQDNTNSEMFIFYYQNTTLYRHSDIWIVNCIDVPASQPTQRSMILAIISVEVNTTVVTSPGDARTPPRSCFTRHPVTTAEFIQRIVSSAILSLTYFFQNPYSSMTLSIVVFPPPPLVFPDTSLAGYTLYSRPLVTSSEVFKFLNVVSLSLPFFSHRDHLSFLILSTTLKMCRSVKIISRSLQVRRSDSPSRLLISLFLQTPALSQTSILFMQFLSTFFLTRSSLMLFLPTTSTNFIAPFVLVIPRNLIVLLLSAPLSIPPFQVTPRSPFIST